MSEQGNGGTGRTERALLVIDVQNDYFAGGAWALPDSDKALPHINRLIELARERGDTLVFVQHVMAEGSPVFAKDSEGVKLHADLAIRPDDVLIRKHRPSAFHGTELDKFLRQHGVKEVDVCGFMTQMCCDTTTREAYSRGYKVRLFKDATAAKNLTVDGETIPAATVHRVSLGALASFAQILPTSEA